MWDLGLGLPGKSVLNLVLCRVDNASTYGVGTMNRTSYNLSNISLLVLLIVYRSIKRKRPLRIM